jgi:SAM-dependent methyltransferase
MADLPYRDFYYPLNVFMHILTLEEGHVDALHYGLFERSEDSIAAAQERATDLLFSRLPPPPPRVLDAGCGLGRTLARLLRAGYEAEGITPDERQIAFADPSLPIRCARFEDVDGSWDVILFQESSQYIDSEALFAKAAACAPRVIVMDEFTIRETPEATLHTLREFLDAAARHGFTKTEDLDLTEKAAPTIDYFNQRLPAARSPLLADLGINSQQIDDLVTSGIRYRRFYRDGVYGYRLLQFVRA